MKIGFDNDKYISLQSKAILDRIKQFDNKLYLEFGGKIFDDYHASRVLPGFLPDSKIKMLLNLRKSLEIIISVSSLDIEKNKIRQDLGISYKDEVFRMINFFKENNFDVNSVVITRYKDTKNTKNFIEKLKNTGINYYFHYEIENYPYDVDFIASEKGYGKNDYIQTKKPLIVVTGPGPGSGKLSVCLSQLYNDEKFGQKSGYAKFETFPVWNLPLTHPVNLAYEAATADLNDVNMIDWFYLEKMGEVAVNYNRDLEAFPILEKILDKITGKSPYSSPTEMGVNMVGFCFSDEEIIKNFSKNEIIRRYFSEKYNLFLGKNNKDGVEKIEKIFKKAEISLKDRKVIDIANSVSLTKNTLITAIELENGEIITGKQTDLMTSSAACIINVLKKIADIKDSIHIISPSVLETLKKLKINIDSISSGRLNVNDVLIAISITATTSPIAQLALDQIEKLRNLDSHSSGIISDNDVQIYKNLGICVSFESNF